MKYLEANQIKGALNCCDAPGIEDLKNRVR